VSPLRMSDHPVLLSSLLFLCNSSDATRKWTVGSSDGTWVSPYVPTRPTIAPTLVAKVPSVHLTVSFLFLSCSVLTLDFPILACGFLASLGPRSVDKDMLKQYG
jgi:hypothetical protein